MRCVLLLRSASEGQGHGTACPTLSRLSTSATRDSSRIRSCARPDRPPYHPVALPRASRRSAGISSVCLSGVGPSNPRRAIVHARAEPLQLSVRSHHRGCFCRRNAAQGTANHWQWVYFGSTGHTYSKFQCWAADSDHKTVRVTTSISMTSAPFALQHTDVPAAYCADRNSNERADATKDGPGTTALASCPVRQAGSRVLYSAGPCNS